MNESQLNGWFGDIHSVEALLRGVFGSHTRLAEYEELKNDPDYLVIRARLEPSGQEVVIKLAGPQPPYPCPFDRTAFLYQMVARQTDIPMPEIFAVDVACQAWPWSYMVKSHIPGEVWALVVPDLDAEQREQAYAVLGRAVAQIHRITFPTFGEIDSTGRVIHGSSLVAALLERAKVWIRDKVFFDFFAEVLEKHTVLFHDISSASLTHEDLHNYNILLAPDRQGWRIASILDFDKAWAGHGESDLARLDLWRGMSSPALWQAYASIHPLPPEFSLRKLIYQLLWCLEYAETTPVHLADTLRVCDELGVILPQSFQ